MSEMETPMAWHTSRVSHNAGRAKDEPESSTSWVGLRPPWCKGKSSHLCSHIHVLRCYLVIIGTADATEATQVWLPCATALDQDHSLLYQHQARVVTKVVLHVVPSRVVGIKGCHHSGISKRSVQLLVTLDERCNEWTWGWDTPPTTRERNGNECPPPTFASAVLGSRRVEDTRA